MRTRDKWIEEGKKPTYISLHSKNEIKQKKHPKFLISVELQIKSQINNKYFRTLNLFINKNNKLNDFNIKKND